MNKTLRDIIADVYISGATSTLNAVTATATDMVNAVVDSTGAKPALRVDLTGGGSGTVTFGGNVTVLGDLTVSGSTHELADYVVNYLYLGPPNQDNSWRVFVNGSNLAFERRESGSWIDRGSLIGS